MGARDEEAVTRFVERFADTFVQAGMPRMPSRVFCRLLATDSGRLTAGELAEALQASPAAISGAVQYLIGVELVRRVREPGSRRDHYLVRHDLWYEAMVERKALLDHWSGTLAEGLEAVGPSTEAGDRLRETLEFFEFMAVEMPLVLERWRQSRKG